MFQSTLPHGERPLVSSSAVTDYSFNPRSRTGSDSVTYITAKLGIVSIHAPARGATKSTKGNKWNYKSFNPRSRTGSDWQAVAPYKGSYVSIHAPARGATVIVVPLALVIWFQSTLPHGERLYKYNLLIIR